MDYGNKLYELRKLKSLSQEQVANELGVSRQSVSLWETNQASPSMENLIGFAKLFNMSLDDLVGLKKSETISKNEGSPLYTIDYLEDKKVVYRRDYKYLNSTADSIMFLLSLFFYLLALISFMRAPRLEIEIARVILIIGFICIMIGTLIYPLYMYINIKKRISDQNKLSLEFYTDKIAINCTNCVQKTVQYEMINYYIDKKDYLVMYMLKGQRLYVPKQNIKGFDEFLSKLIERRKTKKPIWK
jgi:transcriptional regulator with XRE-family HTH domain